MRNFLSKTLINILLIMSICACTKTVSEARNIVYFGGQGLYSLDADTNEVIEALALPTYLVENISYVDSSKLLLSTWDLDAGPDRYAVSEYDIATGLMKGVARGRFATYVAHGRTLIFYDRGAWRISTIDRPDDYETIPENVALGGLAAPIPISAHEILLEIERSSVEAIVLYDVATRRSTVLSGLEACSLHNAVWISLKRKLLCRSGDGNAAQWVLTSLDGKDSKQLKAPFNHGHFWPVAYLPTLDAVLIQERYASAFRLKHRLWRVTIDTGESARLFEDLIVGCAVAIGSTE